MSIVDNLESTVRNYCRSFPVVFESAAGSIVHDENNKSYIDFFLCAGSLNYGHNDPVLKESLIQYIQSDGLANSLDLVTPSKVEFITTLSEIILAPRNMDYKVQFTGPTGTNAIEAAIKLAKKIKKRSNVIAFTGAYHGLTSGSLALTANRFYRNEYYINRNDVSFLPYDGYFGLDVDTSEMLKKLLEDSSSGLDLPCAIILETTQAEGGVNIASNKWLKRVEELCKRFDILLIIDDIQVGCGRSGSFFSFESSGISPDIIALSKSLSGFGLPLSLLLIRPELDQWEPGEHTGTFRGNNLAFVSGAAVLQRWGDPKFIQSVRASGDIVQSRLNSWHRKYPSLIKETRGKGMIYGVEFFDEKLAKIVVNESFKRGLIVECCGRGGCVVKIMPALNISQQVLNEGLDIFEFCLNQNVPVCADRYSCVIEGAS